MHLLMFYMNTPIAYLNPGFRQNINYNSIICTKQFCLFFYEMKIMGNFITWLLGKSHDKNCNCSAVIQQLLARNCEKKEEVIMYPCHGYIIHSYVYKIQTL